MEAVEQELLRRKFTREFSAEVVDTLREFLKALKGEMRREMVEDERGEGLLALIAEEVERAGDGEVGDSAIVEAVFRCKLLSLPGGRNQE